MHFTPYLNFDGTCETAFKFYAECLGGEIEAMMPFGDTPACEHVAADERDRIMHARLKVGEQLLMGSDCIAAHPYEGVKGASVALAVEDPAQAEQVFNALSEGGTVTMPLQQTFWATKFGMLVDRFGVPWMINCEAT